MKFRFDLLGLTIIILAFTLEACEKPQTASGETSRPNIVLILSDDQGWSDYGFMGSELARTPNLDALAARGARFSYAFNTGNICRPSLRSILTGYYPAQYEAQLAFLREFRDPLDTPPLIRQIETLPRLLASRGYVSFQGGKYWEGDARDGGFTHGHFESLDHANQPAGVDDAVPSPLADSGNTVSSPFATNPLFEAAGGERLELGRSTMQPLLHFIGENQQRPFFVWFAPLLPHRPFDASANDRAPYEEAGLGVPEIGYLANIARLDRRVGELLAYLEARNLTEKTLIVFLSDNGWEAGTTENYEESLMGGARGKSSIHETGFRTPLIMSWPTRIAPFVDDHHLVSTVDLFATLLDLADIESPTDRWGQSLGPLLKGTGTFSRTRVMAEVNRLRKPPGGLFPYVQDLHALFLRTSEWRYVSMPERGLEALYSMISDPEETKNLCGQNLGRCDRFDHELEIWREAMNVSPPRAP